MMRPPRWMGTALQPVRVMMSAHCQDEGAVGGGVKLQSIRDNPFFPLTEGGSFSYRAAFVPDPDAVLSPEDYSYYQVLTTEVTEETITVQMVFDEVNSEVKWLCGEEGLYSSEYAQFNFTDVLDAEIETANYSGVTLPMEDMWFIGSSWDMDFEINMAYSVEGIEIASVMIGDLTNEITGIEAVSVPAGDFAEAYVVEGSGTLSFDTNMMGSQLTMSFPVTNTTWYVRGVGMVKQLATDETGLTVTELIAYE